MDKIKLVQDIGTEVCEGCGGPGMDCGENPGECFRIANAVDMLDNAMKGDRNA